MTAAVRTDCAACCCDEQDIAWGRLPGASPPLRTWIPAAVCIVAALVLSVVVILLVRPPRARDDPDPADQRDGLVVDGPVVPVMAAGTSFGGHPIVVLFERSMPTGPAFESWKHSIADDHVQLVVRSGRAGDVLARLVGMPTPVDGGRPVGYAVIDASRRVRYATLDPMYQVNSYEVSVIVHAVS